GRDARGERLDRVGFVNHRSSGLGPNDGVVYGGESDSADRGGPRRLTYFSCPDPGDVRGPRGGGANARREEGVAWPARPGSQTSLRSAGLCAYCLPRATPSFSVGAACCRAKGRTAIRTPGPLCWDNLPVIAERRANMSALSLNRAVELHHEAGDRIMRGD